MTFAICLWHCQCCTPWPWPFSRSNISNVNISKMVIASKNAQVWSLYRLIFAMELDHFECCTLWPFPKFSRSNFPNNYFDKYTRKMQTLLLLSDRKSGVCNRMVPVRMLSIMTLTYIFKVTKFEMWISRKRCKLTKHAQVWLLYRLIFAIEWDHCECCTPWFWPNFSGQYISVKWLAKHASYGFYRFWYLPLKVAIPKVVLCDVTLLFQGKLFQMYLGSNASCTNMSSTTFIDVDIYHHNRTNEKIILCFPD